MPYHKPAWYFVHLVNPVTTFAVRHLGFRRGEMVMLEVRKRSSGEWQRIPVNLLRQDGQHFLVSMHGDAEWVRNARAAGNIRLVINNQPEEFRVQEVPTAERPALLRAYVRRWPIQAKPFFATTSPNAPESEFAKIAADHPVFHVTG